MIAGIGDKVITEKQKKCIDWIVGVLDIEDYPGEIYTDFSAASDFISANIQAAKIEMVMQEAEVFSKNQSIP
jgi:hypothetical protein